MPSGVISGIRLATTPALYSMCTDAMPRLSTPTWATIVSRLFLPIARKACCCSVARQILAHGTFRAYWCKQKMAKRGRSTRLLRGVRSPGTRRATAASWWVQPIPRNYALFALCAPACRSWCLGLVPRVATWRRLQRRGWMNTVNGPLLQFRVPSYMPAMIVIMLLLLNMKRGRCATGSTRRGGRRALCPDDRLLMSFHQGLLLWKLIGMALAPGFPQGGDEGLDDPRHGTGQQGAHNTKKLDAGQQRQQRDHRMQPHSAAKDTWGQNLSFKPSLDQGDKDRVDECCLPSL